ncbi:MAG TPA: hypothetical protein VN493_06380 [Thermoanaerobaculia bacterium]|nr:hypothetical protein [Thermoanaerobaculia bacterium]
MSTGRNDLLTRYLESDIQGSATSAQRLLDLLERIDAGEIERWEETGNAHTLELGPDGATIVSEWDEEAPPQQVSLAELRDALTGWLALLGR